MTVSNNTGGGIVNLNIDLGFSIVSIDHSRITGNSTQYSGGGVMSSRDATTTITDSTIERNHALQDGGGIWGSTTITDSTISRNRADGYGGGIWGGGTIVRSKIERNEAGVHGGGIWNVFGVFLTDSVVRNNIPDDCVNASPTSPPTGRC
jgi:hypothetical protein